MSEPTPNAAPADDEDHWTPPPGWDPDDDWEPSNNDALNYEPATDEWGFPDPDDFYDP